MSDSQIATIEFELAEEDLFLAREHITRRSPAAARRTLALRIGAPIAVGGAIVLVGGGAPFAWAFAGAAALVVLVLQWLGGPALGRAAARRQWSRDQARGAHRVRVTIGVESVVVESAAESATSPWSDIQGVDETDEALYLLLERDAIVIPKRAFRGRGSPSELVARMRELQTTARARTAA